MCFICVHLLPLYMAARRRGPASQTTSDRDLGAEEGIDSLGLDTNVIAYFGRAQTGGPLNQTVTHKQTHKQIHTRAHTRAHTYGDTHTHTHAHAHAQTIDPNTHIITHRQQFTDRYTHPHKHTHAHKHKMIKLSRGYLVP